MKEIQLLPEPLLETEAVKTVRGWFGIVNNLFIQIKKNQYLFQRYEQSFEDILEFEEADASSDKTLSK